MNTQSKTSNLAAATSLDWLMQGRLHDGARSLTPKA
jgi:hypothetical protein